MPRKRVTPAVPDLKPIDHTVMEPAPAPSEPVEITPEELAAIEAALPENPDESDVDTTPIPVPPVVPSVQALTTYKHPATPTVPVKVPGGSIELDPTSNPRMYAIFRTQRRGLIIDERWSHFETHAQIKERVESEIAGGHSGTLSYGMRHLAVWGDGVPPVL